MSTSHEEHVVIHDDSNEPQSSNPLVRVAIIIGIVLILLLIAFSIVRLVPKIISSFGTANVSFSSLFNPKDKITVTASPEEVKSGDTFLVSWKNNTADTDGSMIWQYKCVSGVTVEYNSISGLRPVVCNTKFPLPTNSDSYSFTVKSTNKSNTEIPMSVSFWSTDLSTQKYSGSSSITVIAPGSETPTTGYNPDYTNKGTQTTNTTKPSANNSNKGTTNTTVNKTTNTTTYNTGAADLQVSLSKIGRINRNGVYEQTNTFAEDDRVTVIFVVSNRGNGRSGSWNLRADLPTKTSSDRVFVSGNQPSLKPGDSYQLTISFDAFDPNADQVKIVVNANDNNQSNNTLIIPVDSNGDTNDSNSDYNSTGSRADLVVRILDVGVMTSNNQFRRTSNLTVDDKIAIKFEVQNIGDRSTGSWRFTADLPTVDGDTFRSGTQASLAPGETKAFTLGFDNPDNGSNTISVDVDSDDNVDENRENNNSDSVRISVDN